MTTLKKGIYQVGGSVRDELLYLTHKIKTETKDLDFVVVGYTEKEFLNEYPTAEKVGKAFPVYIVDGMEYAFARIERKTGKGHKGFEFEVNPNIKIQEDLQRRDLTINGIVKDENGQYVDYVDGMKDMTNKVLRHISSAFVEDPLRVYRVARFASKLPEFTVAPETIKLMNSIKDELLELSPERVWKEFERALSEKAPHRFIEVLLEANVLDVHFPELYNLTKVPSGRGNFHEDENDALDHSLKVLKRIRVNDPIVKFASLVHDLGKYITFNAEKNHFHGHDVAGINLVKRLTDRLSAPSKYKTAGMMASKFHMIGFNFESLRASTLVKKLNLIKKFPLSDVSDDVKRATTFFEIVYADGKVDLITTIPKLMKVFKVKLPVEKQNLGKKSGEILFQMRVRKMKHLLRILKDENV